MMLKYYGYLVSGRPASNKYYKAFFDFEFDLLVPVDFIIEERMDWYNISFQMTDHHLGQSEDLNVPDLQLGSCPFCGRKWKEDNFVVFCIAGFALLGFHKLGFGYGACAVLF